METMDRRAVKLLKPCPSTLPLLPDCGHGSLRKDWIAHSMSDLGQGKRKLNGRQEAHLVAITCSAAPEGHTRWSLRLLADKVVAMEFAESYPLRRCARYSKERTQAMAEE